MDFLRTLLFLPGNNPGMLQNGGVFGADAVILDLEDAVSPEEKDAARHLVKSALHNVNYRKSKTLVRINPLNCGGKDDIAAVVPESPDAILLPKAETAGEICQAVSLIEQTEYTGQRPVRIIPLLETPLGIIQAYTIATAHPRVWALSFGAEDYTAALGAVRTPEGNEIFQARTLVIAAAAAAGIDAIDTPFTDAQDEDGLLKDTRLARDLGFRGKLTINPRQVDSIHQVFTPDEADIYWARRVLHAINEARTQGTGVIALDGKMIDAPIVLRAERILMLAGCLNARQENEK
ncbi:CoA ester lyase [Salmonella enterica subsp. enterica serovar Livingstone]|nr:CoA ester lyase [Salmonella enterica subsp. enterica serovar Livingstone]